MEALIDIFLQEKEIDKLQEELEAGQDRQLIAGLSGGAKSIFFKTLQQSLEQPDSHRFPEFVASTAYI